MTEDVDLLKSMKFCRTGITLSIVAFMATGCAVQTATYGTGQTVEAGLARDLASIATFGTFGKKKAERISYRERAALVVPSDQQFASIPAPVDSISTVNDNFPGRAAEIAKAKSAEEKQAALNVEKQAIGVSRAQPLTTSLLKNKDERDGGDIDLPNSAAIGSAVPLETRELTKTPEEYAAERGVTVAELPKALQGGVVQEKSLLARAGLVKPKVRRRTESLTDVPAEYRTVQQETFAPPVSQVPVGQNGAIVTPQSVQTTASQVNRASDPDGTYSVEPYDDIAPPKKKKRFILF